MQDEFNSFISRKHFEQTITGQDDKPEEKLIKSAAIIMIIQDRHHYNMKTESSSIGLLSSHAELSVLLLVPVIGCELASSQVGGRNDSTALVLTVPYRTRHLEDTQHSAVPETHTHTECCV